MRKMTLFAIIFVNFLQLSVASAEAQNRCFLYAKPSLFVSISVGEEFENSKDLVADLWNIDYGFKALEKLQAAGRCPQKSIVNLKKCFIYQSLVGYSKVSIGETFENSSDLFVGTNEDQSLPVASKLMELGQCSEVVLR